MSRWVAFVLCMGVALVAAGPVAAAPASSSPDAAAQSVTFTVTVIHAHNAKAGVDPKLGGLAEYLPQSFARYKGFDRLGAHTATVAAKAATSTKLPDGKKLTLEFRGVDKGFVKVYLELDGLKTTVDVRNGGLFFQAGRTYKGGILVLAIGAKTTTASRTGG